MQLSPQAFPLRHTLQQAAEYTTAPSRAFRICDQKSSGAVLSAVDCTGLVSAKFVSAIAVLLRPAIIKAKAKVRNFILLSVIHLSRNAGPAEALNSMYGWSAHAGSAAQARSSTILL